MQYLTLTLTLLALYLLALTIYFRIAKALAELIKSYI